MSILRKPYEISVWKDVWDDTTNKFNEVQVCVIGSDKMESQSRALSPTLTRNVNGSKKMTFKMYKKYIDSITGELVENPFSEYLVGERKIKLRYGKSGEYEWYDFIIKNIVENSSNYLYTYQLEDALVNELSRNGYGITLDDELMNNIGTATELGNKVLAGSDWTANSSEVIVEKVSESLVYLKITAQSGVSATKIKDQKKDNLMTGITTESTTIPKDSLVLGFYSSCTSKPYRFQFIYLSKYGEGNKPTAKRAEDRTILEEDCQYYIDVGTSYTQASGTEYYLPSGFSVAESGGGEGKVPSGDYSVSRWYKGDRIGFTQKGVYSTKLEKSLLKYTGPSYPISNNETDTKYYGFVQSDTSSAILLANFAASPQIDSLSGWTGSTSNKDKTKTNIAAVYGRFGGGKFISAQEDLSNGSFESNKSSYKSYLKCTFYDKWGLVLNSGPFANRVTIGNMTKDDKWACACEVYTSTGAEATDININLLETKYSDGKYSTLPVLSSDNTKFARIKFEKDTTDYTGNGLASKYKVFKTVGKEIVSEGVEVNYSDPYTTEQFKKNSNVRISFNCNAKDEDGESIESYGTTGRVYYITNLEFFKLVLDKDNKYVIPLSCGGDTAYTPEIKRYYKFFTADQLENNNVLSVDDLTDVTTLDALDYSTYKPVLNTNGEKIRAINVKESNYFNNLQTIAENFETWLELKITRNDNGAITAKEAIFKNYAGKDNYASFKYGINLKDIQRTTETKSIVTKLIVKPNNNEHAENGFCTIQRATSNPTGENFLYDFEYFFNQELLNEVDYNDYVYGPTGYFSELKRINNEMKPLNEEKNVLERELIALKADKEIYETTVEVASSQIEKVNNDLESFLGVSASSIGAYNAYQTGSPSITYENEEYNEDKGTFYWTGQNSKNGIRVTDTTVGSYSDAEGFSATTLGVWYSAGETGKTYPSDAKNKEDSRFIAYRVWRKKEPINQRSTKLTRQLNTTVEYTKTQWDAFGQSETYFLDKLDQLKYYKIKDGESIYYAYYNFNTESATGARDDTRWALTPADNLSSITGEIERKTISTYKTAKWVDRTVALTNDRYCVFEMADGYYYWRVASGETPAWTKDGTNPAININITIRPKVVLGNSTTYINQYTAVKQVATIAADAEYVDMCAEITPYTDLINKKDVATLLQEYALYTNESQKASSQLSTIEGQINTKNRRIAEIDASLKEKQEEKNEKNLAFYTRYSRFIQEGTWQDDKYLDDELYYIDALSVMYDSCYPKVSYNINVIALEALPGYEGYTYQIGDKTYVEDKEFFGSRKKEEVVITEMTDNLDDPSKKQIKVQNFKNQFQDLFQKITATVQQAEYRQGAYEKSVKLVEGEPIVKSQFLIDALDAAAAKITVAGQQTVTSDVSGITITEQSNPTNSLRMVGGAILLSKENENGEKTWTTGLTSDGISASLITAGTLNAGEVKIMSGRDPVFRWDDLGITAFDKQNNTINTQKFVRFDKNGLYGMDSTEDGGSYSPSTITELNEKATFALTWDGLKVSGTNGTTLHIGKQGNNLIEIKNSNNETILGVDDIGGLQINGNLSSGTTLDGSPITSIIDEHIEDFNFHTIEYQDKIDDTVQKTEELKAEMVPLSFYPNGVIIEETTLSGPSGIVDETDLTKIYCYYYVTYNEDGTIDNKVEKYYYITGEGSSAYWTSVEYAKATESTEEFIPFPEIPSIDRTKTYYVKPTKLYWQYKNNAWTSSTNIDDVATAYTGFVDTVSDTEAILGALVGYNKDTDNYRSSALASIIGMADEKKAELDGLVTFRGGGYSEIRLYDADVESDQAYIYYDEETTKFGYYNNGQWNWVADPNSISSLDDDQIYCCYPCSIYLIYIKNEKKWEINTSMPTAAAGFFAKATADKAEMSLVAQKEKSERESAIATVTARATKDKAQTELLASYITGGKYEMLDSEEWSSDGKDTKTIYCLYLSSDEKYHYYYYQDNTWKDTTEAKDAGLQITTAGFMLEAINGQSTATLNADLINMVTKQFTVADKDGSVYFQAGGVETTVEGQKVYVPEVYMAGWSVNSNSITQGTLGQDESFHMYSKDRPTGAHFGETDANTPWSLGIGENFGVTTDGTVYATGAHITGTITGSIFKDSEANNIYLSSTALGSQTIGDNSNLSLCLKVNNNFGVDNNGNLYASAGKIGNVQIGDIYSKDETNSVAQTAANGVQIGGRNLLVGSTTDDYWTLDLSTKAGKDGDAYKLDNATGSENYLYFYNSSNPLILKAGEQYTISFEAKKSDNLKGTDLFILQDGWASVGADGYALHWGFTPTTTYAKYYYTFTPNNKASTFNNCQIRFDNNGSTTGTSSLWIKNLKLERGTRATDWTEAPEDTTARLSAIDTTAKDLFGQASQAAADALVVAQGAQTAAGTAETNARNYTDEQNLSLQETLTAAYEKYTTSAVSTLDGYVAKYLLGSSASTVVGDTYLISPYICGGYLNITGTRTLNAGEASERTVNTAVIIDPTNLTNTDYIFQVHNGEKISVGIDRSGNARFEGAVYATSGEIGSLTITQVEQGVADAATAKNAVDGIQGTVSGFESALSNKLNAKETTGTYTWEFNSASGLYMYNNTNPVFKLDSGGLYMLGTIGATDGNIGGWQIDEVGSTANKVGVGIWKTNLGPIVSSERTYVTSGMAALDTSENHVVFWSGCPEGLTPWQYNDKYRTKKKDYSVVTPFYVTSLGELKASNILFGSDVKKSILYYNTRKVNYYYLNGESWEKPSEKKEEQCLSLYYDNGFLQEAYNKTSGDNWMKQVNGQYQFWHQSHYDSQTNILHWPVSITSWEVAGYKGLSEEAYYRFTSDDFLIDKLRGVEKGKTYRIKGKIALQHVNWPGISTDSENNFLNIVFRSEYCTDTNTFGGYDWKYLNTTLLLNEATETNVGVKENGSYETDPVFSQFQDFSVVVTIPEDAEGSYFSFQLYRKDNNKPYAGWVQVKDLEIVEINTQINGYLSQENGLKLWSGERTNDNLLLEVTQTGLTAKGSIVATSGSIGGWTISENSLQSGFVTFYGTTSESLGSDKIISARGPIRTPTSTIQTITVNEKIKTNSQAYVKEIDISSIENLTDAYIRVNEQSFTYGFMGPPHPVTANPTFQLDRNNKKIKISFSDGIMVSTGYDVTIAGTCKIEIFFQTIEYEEQFYLTSYGSLVAQSIQANEGKIGKWKLGVPSEFYGTDFEEKMHCLHPGQAYDGVYYYLCPDGLYWQRGQDRGSLLETSWENIGYAGRAVAQASSLEIVDIGGKRLTFTKGILTKVE